MKNSFLERLSKIYRDKIIRKRIHRIFSILAALVVFITSYALILPAITVERDRAAENNIPLEGPTNSVQPAQDQVQIDAKAGLGLRYTQEDQEIPEGEKLEPEGQIQIEGTQEGGSGSPGEKNQAPGDPVQDPEAEIKEEVLRAAQVRQAPARRDMDFTYRRRGLRARVQVLNTDLPEDAVLRISPLREEDLEEKLAKKEARKQDQMEISPFLPLEGQGTSSFGQTPQDQKLIPGGLDLEDILRPDPFLEEIIREDQGDQDFLDLFLLDQIKSLATKDQMIDQALEGNIEEILYYDISFFTPGGEGLEVDQEARITLDLAGQGLTQGPDEEISIGHFHGDKLTLLEAQVQLGQEDQVEEITFETQGFSVFAVIKHGIWTEARIQNGVYTIITPVKDRYKYINNDSIHNIVSGDLEIEDIKDSQNGPNSEQPYLFEDMERANKYNRYTINKKSGNRYVIFNTETSKYLDISEGDIKYSDSPKYFKFYINQAFPNQIRIQSDELTGDKRPYSLAYDMDNDRYYVSDNYNQVEEGLSKFSYHQLIKNERYYKNLNTEEVRNLQSGNYVITSILSTKDNRKSMSAWQVPTEFISGNMRSTDLDSTSLREVGSDLLYPNFDPDRELRFMEPTVWKFTRRDDKGGMFNIQSPDGRYVKIDNPRNNLNNDIKLIDEGLAKRDEPAYLFEVKKYNNNNDNIIEIQSSINSQGINLKDGKTSWYTYSRTANNRAILSRPEGLVENKYEKEEELVEAIIPDGHYIIANREATAVMRRRLNYDYQPSDSSGEYNGEIKDRYDRYFGQDRMYHIERQSDGSYRISPKGLEILNQFLYVTNLQYGRYEYKRLGFGEINYQPGSEVLKIATLKDRPDEFYIYNDFASLEFYSDSGGFWASKIGSLGTPLRLYRVDDINTGRNHRFTHQESADSENWAQKLADIPNGSYVIGNSPNIEGDYKVGDPNRIEEENNPNFEAFKNKQTIYTIKDGTNRWAPIEAYIHYNEKAQNDSKQHHTIEEMDNNSLQEWDFIQLDQPGHYHIKRKSDGSYLRLNLDPLNAVGTEEEVIIYKDKDKVDQVLITQGNYRLRFDKDENRWRVISNSEPLTEADYHYIGKKIEGQLHFQLTNPEEGTGNSWLKNVRLMETIWAEDLEGNLENNIPKGFHDELGPIGQIYNHQYPDRDNPYRGLYRLEQKPLEGLDASDHYKEYALIGWEISLNGKTYLIDRNAEFIASDEMGVKGIRIERKYVKDKGQSIKTDLFVPYANKDNPFKTKWLEVSAPLYFYFNYKTGIMDIERIMSTEELLNRESDNSGFIFAIGRLFYGEDLIESKHENSSVTMNKKIQDKFRIRREVNFPESITDPIDESERNQIYISKIAKVPTSTTTQMSYDEPNFPITSGLVKERSINWLRESNNILAILKKPKTEDGGEDVLFQPDKSNIHIGNYDIDYLWLDRRTDGSFIQGIVYGKTAELVIEKQFRNLSVEEPYRTQQ